MFLLCRFVLSADPTPHYGSVFDMAQNGRFGLSVRVLTQLALTPETMQTSATLAETLHTSPVMVRRIFSALHKAGVLVQRKGPQGGAKLKVQAKAIGLGDIYAAVSGEWPMTQDKPVDAALKRLRADAIAAMNETSLATLAKKIRKGAAKATPSPEATKAT